MMLLDMLLTLSLTATSLPLIPALSIPTPFRVHARAGSYPDQNLATYIGDQLDASTSNHPAQSFLSTRLDVPTGQLDLVIDAGGCGGLVSSTPLGPLNGTAPSGLVQDATATVGDVLDVLADNYGMAAQQRYDPDSVIINAADFILENAEEGVTEATAYLNAAVLPAGTRRYAGNGAAASGGTNSNSPGSDDSSSSSSSGQTTGVAADLRAAIVAANIKLAKAVIVRATGATGVWLGLTVLTNTAANAGISDDAILAGAIAGFGLSVFTALVDYLEDVKAAPGRFGGAGGWRNLWAVLALICCLRRQIGTLGEPERVVQLSEVVVAMPGLTHTSTTFASGSLLRDAETVDNWSELVPNSAGACPVAS